MNTLPGKTTTRTDRKVHLREYILACVTESALSWDDVVSPGLTEKLIKTLVSDVKAMGKDIEGVLSEFGKNGKRNLMRIAAMKFMQFAEGVANR